MKAELLPRFFAGVRASVPIMIGFIGIGIAAGIVEVKAGLSPLESVLLSLILYAGASQFVFASLWTLHTGPFSMIMTIFFMNLRHLLFSAAMTTRLRRRKWYEYVAIGSQLTDESFSLATVKFDHHEPIDTAWMIGLNTGPYLTWATGNAIGAMAFEWCSRASVPTDVFSYALVAMFCSILVLQIAPRKERVFYFFIAALSIGFCILFRKLGLGSATLPVTIIVASTAGYLLLGLLKRQNR